VSIATASIATTITLFVTLGGYFGTLGMIAMSVACGAYTLDPNIFYLLSAGYVSIVTAIALTTLFPASLGATLVPGVALVAAAFSLGLYRTFEKYGSH